jgi:hypothetical protein
MDNENNNTNGRVEINIPYFLEMLSKDCDRVDAYSKLSCPKPMFNVRAQCPVFFNFLDMLKRNGVCDYEHHLDMHNNPLGELVVLTGKNKE